MKENKRLFYLQPFLCLGVDIHHTTDLHSFLSLDIDNLLSFVTKGKYLVFFQVRINYLKKYQRTVTRIFYRAPSSSSSQHSTNLHQGSLGVVLYCSWVKTKLLTLNQKIRILVVLTVRVAGVFISKGPIRHAGPGRQGRQQITRAVRKLYQELTFACNSVDYIQDMHLQESLMSA